MLEVYCCYSSVQCRYSVAVHAVISLRECELIWTDSVHIRNAHILEGK